MLELEYQQDKKNVKDALFEMELGSLQNIFKGLTDQVLLDKFFSYFDLSEPRISRIILELEQWHNG